MPLSEEVTKIISTTIKNGSRVLDLRKLRLRSNGVKDLVEALKQMPNLTSLNLEGNYIGKGGATALADALKQMPNLTSLDLAYNNLGNDGVTALAGCLKDTNITVLYLVGNNIGDEGAKALAGVLSRTQITELELDWNEGIIGAKEDRALYKASEANCERIKNEVIAFKNELLDKKNESEDVEPIIKKLLNKFGKPASAIHIDEFVKPDEKEQVKAEIVRKISGINVDNIDANIAKFLDIKDCFKLNATSQKGAQEPVTGTPPTTTSKKRHLDKVLDDMLPDERAKNETFVEKLKNEATKRDGHSRQ